MANKLIIESELHPMTKLPEDNCGYYGIVLKPKYVPLWLCKKFKHLLPVREGWLNVVSPERIWWFDRSKGRENSKQVQPIFWCSIRSYYKTKVTFLGGSPFNAKIEDPGGSYKIAK